MATRRNQASNKSLPGRLRIVAGKWRSRLLPIEEHEGLRPTSARIRETLFNWLSPNIKGSHCLDLFAGTGALGFEALSRGAAAATLVEKTPRIATILEASAKLLCARNVKIECIDALSFLQSKTSRRYDIVFLDPPFASNLVEQCCRLLQSNAWLTEGGVVYIELDNRQPVVTLPPQWCVVKEKQAGNVRYMLAQTP